MILTDANGRPIERPERPAEGAPMSEVIVWMRAVYAYNDRVSDTANAAFADEFRRSR